MRRRPRFGRPAQQSVPGIAPDVPPPAADVLDGGDEFLWLTVLRQIAGGASVERASCKLRGRVYADDERGKSRTQAAQLLDQIEAARTRQRDVRHHDVPDAVADLTEGARGIAGFADDRALEPLVENGADAVPHDRVV